MASSKDTTLLDVGRKCTAPGCQLHDFLPFTCQHCKAVFCQAHFKVDGHVCPDYDEFKHNRVAPPCPFCKEPIAIGEGKDPNDVMEVHFNTTCVVLGGKAKARTGPTCARQRCGKVLFAPIKCDKCSKQFCPAHRFPADHTCAPIPVATSARAPPTTTALAAKASAASASGMAAIKRGIVAANTTATPKPSPAPKPAATTTTTQQQHLNPFNKSDRSSLSPIVITIPAITPAAATQTTTLINKPQPVIDYLSGSRAKAERESRRKGMMERAKKGLLTEGEKAMLAAEEAERAAGGGLGEKKDCVVQ